MVLLDKNSLPIVKEPYARMSRSVTDWLDFTRRLRDRDDIGPKTYFRMVSTDETVRAGIEFISLSVINYIGEYYHPKARIQKFVRRDIAELRRPLASFAESFLTGLWAGHATAELHLAEIGGQIRTVDLPVLPPWSFDYVLEKEGRNAGLVASVIQRQQGGKEQEIGARNLIHWAHGDWFGNPLGLSRLKPAWKYWFPKDILLAAWGKTLEQYASPKPVAQHPTPQSPVNVNGVNMTRGEYLQAQLATLSDSSQLVIDDQTKLHFLELKRAFGSDFESWQAWSNQMILRACLIPALLFTGGDGKGSYALAGKQTEVYNQHVYSVRNAICHAMIQQWIAKLIWLNFGEQAVHGYGEFRGQTLEEEDLKLWSEIFFSMVQAGFVRAHVAEDFDFVRNKLGLPGGVAPPPEATEDGQSGKDGLPGEAPDGLDGLGPEKPSSGPKVPKTKQGRPKSE